MFCQQGHLRHERLQSAILCLFCCIQAPRCHGRKWDVPQSLDCKAPERWTIEWHSLFLQCFQNQLDQAYGEWLSSRKCNPLSRSVCWYWGRSRGWRTMLGVWTTLRHTRETYSTTKRSLMSRTWRNRWTSATCNHSPFAPHISLEWIKKVQIYACSIAPTKWRTDRRRKHLITRTVPWWVRASDSV